MALSVTFSILGFLVLTILTTLLWGKKRACTLPGPKGWPLIGIYPYIPHQFYKYLAEQAKIYGDIFYCRFGLTDLVVVNSLEIADELYRKRGRLFNNRYMDLPEDWDAPIGFSELHVNDKWQELRGFTMKTINTNNFGDRTLEDIINDEFSHFYRHVAKMYTSKPFQPARTLKHCMGNILFCILFKHRKEFGDKQMEELVDAAKDVSEAVNPLSFFILPSFIHFLARFNIIPNKSLRSSQEGIKTIFSVSDAEITSYLNSKKKSRHFVDLFLSARDEKISAGERTFHSLNSLKGVISNLITGGLNSTAVMLCWMVLFMVKYPDVQSKLRQEIEDLTSEDEGLPTLDDKVGMNYLSAFIQEVHRFVSPVATTPSHVVAEDTEYEGKLIPKGTYVAINLWRIHHNENIFSDPFTFKPERFIDENGIFQPSGHVIPFGIGIRVCAGKVMAHKVLLLFLANMVKSFRFQLPEGVEPDTISTEGNFQGIIIEPPNFEIMMTPVSHTERR